jgi:hypothetical protein
VGKRSRLKRERRQSISDVDELATVALRYCGGREHTPAGLVFALRGAQWITTVTGRRSWESKADIIDVIILAQAGARLGAMSRFDYLAARNALIDLLTAAQREALFGALAKASLEAAKASDVGMDSPLAWVPTLHAADPTLPAGNAALLALPETLPAELLGPARPGDPPTWDPVPGDQLTALRNQAAEVFTPEPNDRLAPTPREALTRGLHALARQPNLIDHTTALGGPGEVLLALAVGYDVNQILLTEQLTRLWVAFPTASSAHQLIRSISAMPLSARAMTADAALRLALGHPAINQLTRLDSPTARVHLGENLHLLGADFGLGSDETSPG